MKAVQILILFASTLAFGSPVFDAKLAHGKAIYRAADSDFSVQSSENLTLEQYLNEIWAYDLDHPKIEKSVFQDSSCGDAYFVEFTTRGFWNNVQAEVNFYFQTLTQESQERLYAAILKNYPTQGLPKCLLADRFYTEGVMSFLYHYDPDYTTVMLPSQFMPVPIGYPCAEVVSRPMTSCWNIEDPYQE